MTSAKKISFFIALIFTSIFVVLQIADPTVIKDNIEAKTERFRFFIRGSLDPSDILIVSVDDQSITQIGAWQWDRKVLADLITKIHQGKPKVLGIDIIWSEHKTEESDSALAEALNQGNNVLATGFFVTPGKKPP